MQCRGIGRQLQQLSSDSTPHDRVTIPQICLARSPALDRPRQSTLRYPTGVSNRPTGHHARRDPLPIHQPLHRPPTRCGGSIPITNISRGSQISITPVARPSVPLRAVSSLGGFRTPTAELAAPSLMRPASETLHKGRHSTTSAALSRKPISIPAIGNERSVLVPNEFHLHFLVIVEKRAVALKAQSFSA